jgi:hypothetical protein
VNIAEIVAIGHWARAMRQKSQIRPRDGTIAGEVRPSENLKTPLFGLALSSA